MEGCYTLGHINKRVLLRCGRGSVGRMSPCQGEGHGFESRRPLFLSRFIDKKYYGDVAKWKGKGLQNPYHGFKSRRRLSFINITNSKPAVTPHLLISQVYHRGTDKTSRYPSFINITGLPRGTGKTSRYLSFFKITSSKPAVTPHLLISQVYHRGTGKTSHYLPFFNITSSKPAVTPHLLISQVYHRGTGKTSHYLPFFNITSSKPAVTTHLLISRAQNQPLPLIL